MPSPRRALNVLVYSDVGVSPAALKHSLASLTTLLRHTHAVQLVTASQLATAPWEQDCALLVIPGGRDLQYCRALAGRAVMRISRFVRDMGGRYLGLCGGGYFGARRIAFEVGRGDGYEVQGERPLAFFPGMAEGTVFPGFKYGSEEGAHAALLIDDHGRDIGHIYYNGGCRFIFDNDMMHNHLDRCRVLARYAFDKSPAIVSMGCGQGHVILSGVHPEYAFHELSDETPARVRALLEAAEVNRKKLFIGILTDLLGPFVLDAKKGCSNLPDLPIYTAVGNIEKYPALTDTTLFNPAEYRNHLKTVKFGRNLLFTERIGSTQTFMLDDPLQTESLPRGTVLLAAEQTAGRGRGGNRWISPSPRSSLQFTFTFSHSHGSSLSLLQCVTAVAMITAIRDLGGAQAYIKWPNDLYIRKSTGELGKIGGILVNSQTTASSGFSVIIGCGVNICNCPQLSTVADILDQEQLSSLSPERLLGIFFNHFERLYEHLRTGSTSTILDRYHSLWLHAQQLVNLEAECQSVIIQGIDDCGYLLAKSCISGNIFRLQPDGNSFDMMNGLIKAKK